MDTTQADTIFQQEILSRWPDFDVSGALLKDWINLFRRFEAEDVRRAAARYVLNYDSYKKPQLNKFREILNVVAAVKPEIKLNTPDRYPMYFLQKDSHDSNYWSYGAFLQFYPQTDNPDIAMSIMTQVKREFERMYGGVFRIVVCNNRSDVGTLIEDRTRKRACI